MLEPIAIPRGASLDAAFWTEVARRLTAKNYELKISLSTDASLETAVPSLTDLEQGLVLQGLTRLPQAPVRMIRRGDELHLERLPGSYAGFAIELVDAIEAALGVERPDPGLPEETSIGAFVLDVPENLGWRRVAAIARLRSREFQVQERASEDWSDATPLVLLELSRTGLIVTMGRRIEGEALVVHGEAVYSAIGSSATDAEALAIGLLHDLSATGGARIASVRFPSLIR